MTTPIRIPATRKIIEVEQWIDPEILKGRGYVDFLFEKEVSQNIPTQYYRSLYLPLMDIDFIKPPDSNLICLEPVLCGQEIVFLKQCPIEVIENWYEEKNLIPASPYHLISVMMQMPFALWSTYRTFAYWVNPNGEKCFIYFYRTQIDLVFRCGLMSSLRNIISDTYLPGFIKE